MHVLFLCPRAWQVLRLVDLDGLFMHAVDFVDTFLGLLQLSIKHSLHILLAYIAYHIWLTMNAIVFNYSKCLTRVIVERAHAHAEEYMTTTTLTTKTWGFSSTLRVLR